MEAWRQELYLAHHGIKGQKWGVRNGPPYPLGAGKHSASEKKAGWRSSLSKSPDGADASRKKKKRPPPVQTAKKETAGRLSSSEKGDSLKFDEEKKKRIARNLAIGIGVVAGAGLVSYAAYNNYTGKSMNLEAAFTIHKDNNTRRLFRLSQTPLSELSDEDSVIKAGAMVQRMVRYPSKEAAITYEKAKDILYVAHDKEDKAAYYHMFGVQRLDKNSNFKPYALQIKTKNEIRMPSDRKRVQSFLDMLKDNKFREAFENEMMEATYGTMGQLDRKDFDYERHAQEYYRWFVYRFGDDTSKSRKMYIDHLVKQGYNAMLDDNDANTFSRKPMILFNGTEDTVITGAKSVSKVMDYLGLMKLDPDYMLEDDQRK